MTIRNGVLRVKRTILDEIDTPNTGARETLKVRALNAVREGQGKAAWREYMVQFVDNVNDLPNPDSLSSKQLKRLMGEDATGNDELMNHRRAYLVADGGCTSETIFHFGRNATDTLDQGL